MALNVRSRRDLLVTSIPLGIFLLAGAIRVAHLLYMRQNDPMFTFPVMDARWHVEWARAIALGIWDGAPFFRAPLYPFVLAASFKLFGSGLLAPRVVQVLLGAAGCVLVWALGRRLGGPKVGTISGVLAALYGPLVHFDTEFLIEPLFLPLVTASLLLLLRAEAAESTAPAARTAWMIAGLVAGLATIARPNMLLVAIGCLFWIAWQLPRGARRRTAIVLWLSLYLVPVGGVTLFNAIKGGGIVPVASQGGVNFWIGNNPLSNGKTAITPAYHGPSTPLGSTYRDSVEFNARLEAERRLQRSLRPDEISRYWFGQALEYIREQPGSWLALTGRKGYFLINGYELPSNRELYRVREWSPVLRSLMVERPLALPFGIVLPLALIGVWLASSDRRATRSAHRLLWLFAAVYAIGTVGFFVTARHRLPLVPILVIYAAVAIAAVPGGLRTLRRSRGIAPKAVGVTLVAAASLALCNSSFFDIREYRHREHHMNLGYAYTQLEQYEDALREYEAALEEEPRMVRARYNVGTVNQLMGRTYEARAVFEELTRIAPRYADAWVQLGRLNARFNDSPTAMAAYRQALAIDPGHTRAHYAIALECRRHGDAACYSEYLLQAHRSDPDYFLANIAIGELMLQRGQLDQAREFLRRAARVEPDSRRVLALSRALVSR